jgi:hypothetical protein
MEETNNISERLLEEQRPTYFQKFFCCFKKKPIDEGTIADNRSDTSDDSDTIPRWSVYKGRKESMSEEQEGRTVRFHSCCD